MSHLRAEGYPPRTGRECPTPGCRSVVHDEAAYCHRCRAGLTAGRLATRWGGVYYPPRCSRCRRLVDRPVARFCPRCGKQNLPHAYERASVPRATFYALAITLVAWCAMFVVLGVLSDPRGGFAPRKLLGIGAVLVLPACWLLSAIYRRMRRVTETDIQD